MGQSMHSGNANRCVLRHAPPAQQMVRGGLKLLTSITGNKNDAWFHFLLLPSFTQETGEIVRAREKESATKYVIMLGSHLGACRRAKAPALSHSEKKKSKRARRRQSRGGKRPEKQETAKEEGKRRGTE